MEINNSDNLEEITEKAFNEKKKVTIPEAIEKLKNLLKKTQDEFVPIFALLFKDIMDTDLSETIPHSKFECKNEIVKHVKMSESYCRSISGIIEMIHAAETEGEKFDYWESAIKGRLTYFITPKQDSSKEDKIEPKKPLNKVNLDYIN